MISIIITAHKEPVTIRKTIESILSQKLPEYQILIVAPDEETLLAAQEYAKIANIKIIKDLGKGKPAALNLAVSKASGEIMIFTDGDVYLGKESIALIYQHFKNPKIGAVSGRPISLNSKKNMLGYWSYVLTEIAHLRRKRAKKMRKRFFCTGYLFAIRKNLFSNLPEELLSEDGFISHKVYEKNFEIVYEEKAKVFVKYPQNFNDWIIQKKRSAGGYNQIKKLLGVEIRSLRKESFGFLDFFRKIKTFKESLWLIELFAARIYLWMIIYRDINLRKKSHKDIWLRVESTK